MTDKNPSSAVQKKQIVDLYRQALVLDVPLEAVDQKISTMLTRVDTTARMEKKNDADHARKIRKELPLTTRVLTTALPFVCIVLGLFLVGNAVWPIITYYLFTAPSLRVSSLLAPVPANEVLDVMPQIVTQAQAMTPQEAENAAAQAAANAQYAPPKIIKDELDYSNLANWFTSTTMPALTEDNSVEYQLDIPELDIEDAIVKLGGSNLDKNLIQYPGTALPGQPGEPVIFGHSVLRQFYNPSIKNPRRYFSIFSKIMTLKDGDKIYLTQDNVKYTYVVSGRSVVQPDDTFILDQRYDVRQLKLITCVPEGTFLERGVIIAELVKTE